MALSYSTSKKDELLIFTINTETINQANQGELKEAIVMEFSEDCEHLIVDLSNVREMDSSGLGVLLFGKRLAHSRNGEMFLVGVAPNIENMMKIAQLSRSFDFFDTVDEAISSLQE
ncbi:MAG: anti-sigma factor antagonist [Calditrichaeota bacterium]|nr:MAG: anti-sigma factor antagonist [Calditrichota bacterium]